MTKEINFDLHFTTTEIIPLSYQGDDFLRKSTTPGESWRSIYQSAIKQGLHIRFEYAQIRDAVA